MITRKNVLIFGAKVLFYIILAAIVVCAGYYILSGAGHVIFHL
jgi:hypothetical protein